MTIAEFENIIPCVGLGDDPSFCALGLAGEVGELANLAKKEWRDGVHLLPEIRLEAADVFIYLILYARARGFSLEKAILDKLEILSVRRPDWWAKENFDDN